MTDEIWLNRARRKVESTSKVRHVARFLLERSEADPKGSSLVATTVGTLTAMMAEAAVNDIGYSKVRHWKHMERLSLFEKLKVLEAEFEFEIARGGQGFEALRRAKKIRDALAHAKPFDEHFAAGFYPRDDDGGAKLPGPAWESDIEEARRLFDRVEEFIVDLGRSCGMGENWPPSALGLQTWTSGTPPDSEG